MRLIDERLSAEVLDHIKKWYAKCEETDCMPENGLTIGRLLDTIEALQHENEQLKAELSQWSYLGDIATTELIAERLHYIPTLKHENEQLRAQVERMRELLAKAYDEIETYKCLWKSSKPGGCDCPKPTALQDEIEDALAEIDKAIGGKAHE